MRTCSRLVPMRWPVHAWYSIHAWYSPVRAWYSPMQPHLFADRCPGDLGAIRGPGQLSSDRDNPPDRVAELFPRRRGAANSTSSWGPFSESFLPLSHPLLPLSPPLLAPHASSGADWGLAIRCCAMPNLGLQAFAAGSVGCSESGYVTPWLFPPLSPPFFLFSVL